jgi:hypothetical protein
MVDFKFFIAFAVLLSKENSRRAAIRTALKILAAGIK